MSVLQYRAVLIDLIESCTSATYVANETNNISLSIQSTLSSLSINPFVPVRAREAKR